MHLGSRGVAKWEGWKSLACRQEWVYSHLDGAFAHHSQSVGWPLLASNAEGAVRVIGLGELEEEMDWASAPADLVSSEKIWHTQGVASLSHAARSRGFPVACGLPLQTPWVRQQQGGKKHGLQSSFAAITGEPLFSAQVSLLQLHAAAAADAAAHHPHTSQQPALHLNALTSVSVHASPLCCKGGCVRSREGDASLQAASCFALAIPSSGRQVMSLTPPSSHNCSRRTPYKLRNLPIQLMSDQG